MALWLPLKTAFLSLESAGRNWRKSGRLTEGIFDYLAPEAFWEYSGGFNAMSQVRFFGVGCLIPENSAALLSLCC
ncbi:hypothetical protein GZ78_09020 [Endozoicomonas numazuensis]|uniref:Uncharacterized protein n=1 Tax=Endozoicomonas numazuensis TaxID=1137799 RepID=A0A081NH75_9GAMM|nr:hypothetical protein GZ78_09020 [Endozoicomonas numazuensis]